MSSSSSLIDNAVEQLASLPGVGRKTAYRYVMDLLKRSDLEVRDLTETLTKMKENIRYCRECHNISDDEVCGICAGHKRDRSVICVVEDIMDVTAIENSRQYNGMYHVLGGLISPMDGIGPADLHIDTLLNRTAREEVKEVVLALSATMEGDTTCFYLYKRLREAGVRVTTIARGVAVGDDLEYTDEITLGRSIRDRTLYEHSLSDRS